MARAAFAFAAVALAGTTSAACVLLGGFDDGPYTLAGEEGGVVVVPDGSPAACGALPSPHPGGAFVCGDAGICGGAGDACCVTPQGGACSASLCEQHPEGVKVDCIGPGDCSGGGTCCAFGTSLSFGYSPASCTQSSLRSLTCQGGSCGRSGFVTCGGDSDCDGGTCAAQNAFGIAYGICVR